MKQLGYYFFKYWVWLGLHLYLKKIDVEGLGNVPKEKPLLFLSNHQNALIDVLLIATLCGRKPWYLTRADIFRKDVFKGLFSFLQMLPIYRMRDGKKNLAKNQAIFDQCAVILNAYGCILLFPETNHSLERCVRPLSKGFTRIIDNVLEKTPEMDIQLIPVGQNYQNATEIGDSAALYFGAPISVKNFQSVENRSMLLRKTVFEELKKLTTHIDSETDYQKKIQALEAIGVDFTNPIETNQLLAKEGLNDNPNNYKSGRSFIIFLFYLWNLPIVFLWRVFIKPRVPEPEFMATFRFAFAMLVYPVHYLLGFIILEKIYGQKTACLAVVLHAVVNYLLIKMMPSTSFGQKR